MKMKKRLKDPHEQKSDDLMFKVFMTCTTVGILTLGCSLIYERWDIQDDNLVEEFAEELIQARTGWDVDITPWSAED